MNIKGVIFDKDGTLFDYAAVWGPIVSRAVDEGLSAFPITEKERLDFALEIEEAFGIDRFGVNHPHGMLFRHDLILKNSLHLIKRAFHYHIDPIKLIFVVAKKIHHIADRLEDDLRDVEFPGVYPLFKALHDKGVRIGIVTSDYEWSTGVFLRKMGVYDMVSFIKCHDTKGIKDKPNPDAMHKFADRFSLKTEEIAMVGDTISDMEFGSRGKCGYKIAVLTGSNDVPELSKRADRIYDEVGDIIKDEVLFPELNDQSLNKGLER